MSSYASIRKASRKAPMRYATGGGVRKPGVVVNVIGGQPAPAAAPPMPMPAAPPPMAPPPGPVPPVAGNAALGAMGAPPALKTGGRVPMTAGAASGPGRLEKRKNA